MSEEDWVSPEDWMLDGSCGDHPLMDDWFGATLIEQRRALNVCKTCPVRLKCAEYAIINEIPEGIWGGLTPSDRRQIRANKIQAAKSRKGIPNKKH